MQESSPEMEPVAADIVGAMRAWALIGQLFTGGMVLLAIAVFFALGRGISARTPPTATETMVARAARRMAIPVAARGMRNPIPLTSRVLEDGSDHFADHCAECHANDGSGQTEIGQNLYPRTPDLRLPDTQRLSDGEIFYIINNGVPLTGMPAWSGSHSDEDTWKLVHFIRHLPVIKPAELERMKQMNPVSPHELDERKSEEQFLEGEHPHEAH